MRKISKKAWQKIIPAAVIIAALIFGGVYYALTWDTVTTFRYQAVKQYNYSDVNGPGSLDCFLTVQDAKRTDAEVRKMGYDSNGKLIEAKEGASYGVVAVVKVIQSENVLMESLDEYTLKEQQWTRNYRGYRKIQPWESCRQKQPELISGYTQTRVVIQEMLHQTAATQFRAGDTVTICEPYYVLDGRVPDVLAEKTHGEDRYSVQATDPGQGWIPMEAGETYIIFGRSVVGEDFITSNDIMAGAFSASRCVLMNPDAADLYLQRTGVYCLSDPEKMTGWWPGSYRTMWQESVDYLKKTYDLEKYGLK